MAPAAPLRFSEPTAMLWRSGEASPDPVTIIMFLLTYLFLFARDDHYNYQFSLIGQFASFVYHYMNIWARFLHEPLRYMPGKFVLGWLARMMIDLQTQYCIWKIVSAAGLCYQFLISHDSNNSSRRSFRSLKGWVYTVTDRQSMRSGMSSSVFSSLISTLFVLYWEAMMTSLSIKHVFNQ